MELVIDPEIFRVFYQKIARPLRLRPTAREVLLQLADADVTSSRIAGIIRANPLFEVRFKELIAGLGLKEGVPSVRAAIPLTGMRNTRNFVCALQIARSAPKSEKKDGKKEKEPLPITELLRYALAAEEYATLHMLGHLDLAFTAGLMFDLLRMVARENFGAPKSFDESVAEVYKHGLKAARTGGEIAKGQKGFGATRYVFSACLIHDIGKLAMELLYPPGGANSYAAFKAELAKNPLSRHVRHLMETKKFGLPHEHYSAQLAFHFGLLRDIEPAVLHHHDPYLIKKTNKEMYALACVIALGSNMASEFRIPKDSADPVIKSWLTAELKGFPVDGGALNLIMHKVGNEQY